MVSLFKLLVPRPLFLTVFVLVVVLLTLFIPELSDNPGYVLVAWKNLSVESSLLTAVFVVVFLVVGVALLTFVINRFVGWAFDAGRKQRRADKRTTRGLVALAEGNWSDAEKMLLKGAVKNESPLVNYITAAQAAQEQGEYDSRDEYLKRAHETTRGVDVAIGLTKARLQYESGQLEQSLATLIQLKQHQRSPSYRYVLKLITQVFIKLEDWGHLEEMLPELKKHNVFSDQEYKALCAKCYSRLLSSVKGADNDQKQAGLKKAWMSLPRKMRQDESLLYEYCKKLIEFNAGEQAETELLGFIKKNWSDRLVELYGVVIGDDTGKQLIHARSWLKERPNNAVLLLALGRLSLRNGEWEEARNYFESSVKTGKTAAALGELGRLLSALGEHQASNDCFKEGLAMIGDRLPELPMPPREQQANSAALED